MTGHLLREEICVNVNYSKREHADSELATLSSGNRRVSRRVRGKEMSNKVSLFLLINCVCTCFRKDMVKSEEVRERSS